MEKIDRDFPIFVLYMTVVERQKYAAGSASLKTKMDGAGCYQKPSTDREFPVRY
jgi:hypothetical protein